MSADYRPTRATSNYRSCPHVTVLTVAAAEVRLSCIFSEKVATTSTTHICLTCDKFGSFEADSEFRKHFSVLNHNFSVRAGPPHELFCMVCGDYQFCSLMDKKTGRKRPFLEVPKPIKVEKDKTVEVEIAPQSVSLCPRGLVNMGATCFMNSALQVLCSYKPLVFSKHLTNHIQNCSHSLRRKSVSSLDQDSESDKGKCIPCEFRAVAQALWGSATGDNGSVTPSDLLFALWTSVDYMAGYSQQDAHEFLIAFLSYLEMQLSPQDLSLLDQSEHFNQFYSGTVQSTLKCSHCGYCSVKSEQFVDLNLSVSSSVLDAHDATDQSVASSADDNVPMAPAQELRLVDCLKHFTISEKLSQKMHCPKCGDDQRFQKQLNISQPPEFLILHLKRFDFLKQRKICTRVRFPVDDLDISPYKAAVLESEAEDGPQVPSPSVNASLYRLQGLVCHTGSLHQGHYISYIRGGDSQKSFWIRCDDERVTVVSRSEVERAEGYLLFYAKCKEEEPLSQSV